MKIEVPYPSKRSGLSPNSRPGHWSTAARAKKTAAALAHGLALEAGALKLRGSLPEAIRIAIEVQPRHGGVPDMDNIVASCKAYLDGLAAALGVDDRRFLAPEVRIIKAGPRARLWIEVKGEEP